MLPFLKANIKIALFFFCTLLCFGSLPLDGMAAEYKAQVVSYRLNLRATPSQDADVITVLERHEKMDVLSRDLSDGSWLTVSYKGQKGYIRNREQYIRLIKTNIEKKKNKIQARIQSQEKIVETFSQKEIEIIEGLNETDYALNRARIKLAALTSEIEQLTSHIERLRIKREELVEALAVNETYAGNRLRALYKMNMIGRLDTAGLPSSLFDFFLQQNAMKRVIRSDFELLDQQSEDLKRLDVLEEELKREIQAKSDLEKQVRDQVRINQVESGKKEMILRQIRKKKKLSMAAVESLKDAAVRLDNEIENIQSDDVTGASEESFTGYKGRLKLPVKGEVISFYGPARTGAYNAYTFQKGIDIRAERGEPVKAVYRGEVVFAQWLKGYGNLLIINHGDNYYTLYAHLEEFFKKKGEKVDTGEVVATAGDTGSIKGMCLHFEVRHHGKPVNPMHWLREGA